MKVSDANRRLKENSSVENI